MVSLVDPICISPRYIILSSYSVRQKHRLRLTLAQLDLKLYPLSHAVSAYARTRIVTYNRPTRRWRIWHKWEDLARSPQSPLGLSLMAYFPKCVPNPPICAKSSLSLSLFIYMCLSFFLLKKKTEENLVR